MTKTLISSTKLHITEKKAHKSTAHYNKKSGSSSSDNKKGLKSLLLKLKESAYNENKYEAGDKLD